MSRLEKLPLEVFREIASYLVFFDSKTLSTVSKQCHAYVKLPKCPDKLSWLIYACRLPASSGPAKDLFRCPYGLIVLLRKEFTGLIRDQHWAAEDVFNRWHPREDDFNSRHTHQCICCNVPDQSASPLLIPYFEGTFPESTIAQLLFRGLQHFAAEIDDHMASVDDLHEAPYEWSIIPSWHNVQKECQLNLRWLARRKPAEKYTT